MAVIEMRSPQGRKTSITVERGIRGVDIIFSRTSQGECLIRLSNDTAITLSAMLTDVARSKTPSVDNGD